MNNQLVKTGARRIARQLCAALVINSALLATPGEMNAQTTPAPMPTICNRACWGARAPACEPGNISALTRAIVHHTAGTGDYTTDYEAGKAKVRGVQNYHIDSVGFCDVSYHFLVNAGGHIYEGRNNALFGLPKGYHDCCNNNSFGFNVMGYYHPPYNQTFTQASLDSLNAVIAWRMPAGWSPYGTTAYCGATVGTLDGHRRVSICNNGTAGGSACPGDGIYNSFITDNRSAGPIRNSVAARRTPAPSYTNPPYLFGANTEGWTAGNGLTAPWWTGSGWPGVLVTDQNGGDGYMHSPATSFVGGWDTSVNVQVYPQNGTTAGHDMQLFWKTTGENFWDSAKASPMVGYTAQNSWIRLNLDAGSAKWVGQTMSQLRLDFDQNNQGVRWIVNHIYPQNTPKWWLDSGNAAGWTLGNSLSGLTWTDCCGWPGVMYADQTGSDAYFFSPTFSYLGGVNDKFFVRLFPQNGNTANHQVKVYWTTAGDNTWSESKSSETVYFTAQDAWADLGIRVGANPNWSSDFVTRIRLDVDGNTVNSQTRWIVDYVAIVPQTQQQTIAAVADIIVDNPAATVVGTWTTASSATDKYGADYRFKSKGTGTSYHQYTPNITTAGTYSVYEWHAQGSNRTTVAPHAVAYSGGTQVVNVNQQINGGAWNLLGTYFFNTGTGGNIRISDGFTDAGTIVISDAIKLVYVP